MSRARLAATVLAVAALLLALPGTAAARDCPRTIAAPNAIVLEVSTGEVACERAADARRPVGSAVKLMTALLTLERADLDDTFRASTYRPAPVESQIGLMPGERMTVRDLLKGLLAESGNDAAMTLAEGVSGSERAFVRQMNRRARELELDQHALPQPDRARRAGRVLERARPGQARHLPAQQAVLPPHRQPDRGRAHHRQPPAPVPTTATTSSTASAGSTASRPAARAAPASSSSPPRGVTACRSSPPSSARRARRPATPTACACSRSAGAPSSASPPPGRAPASASRSRSATAAAPSSSSWSAPTASARWSSAATATASRSSRPATRPRSRARSPTGRSSAQADVLQDGRKIATVALVARTEVPAADLAQRTKSWFTRPIAIVLAFALLSGTVLVARRRRRPRGPGPRRAREEARTA